MTTVGGLDMNFRRAAGLVFGYGLLAIALFTVVNSVRGVARVLFGSLPITAGVFFVMANLGAALIVGTGGYVVLQRVRRTDAGYGVDLDWGRVLGP
ncbi:hypothetical protein SAMN04488691_10869 [Haloferax larsenii]|uniref:Uncharacterized protein n=2 Tax=Haloferax larsenii TaxID=302484 RepID=A0A1H7T5D6_HALLR|nr:hypothetical protein SAMN04488691_10869 [Haloferax larsenii]